MAVSSFDIFSPPNNFLTPNLRPRINVQWAGGIGPFDLLYEWDTVISFDSGNLIFNLNEGLTGTIDQALPPSDMGPYGTDWYLRVTITDTGDFSNEIQTIALENPDAHTAPTATASHTQSGFPASNTVDGNEGTEWVSGVSMTSAVIQLDFDFTSAVSIGRIRFLQNNSTYWADSVKVYWSDNGSDYTLVNTFSCVSGWNTLRFSAVSHRYWRLEENATNNYWWRVQEATFHDSATGGTFTLSYDADPTSALPWNESLANMETAIEGLTGITAVTVTGIPGVEYIVEFTNPTLTDMLMLVVDDNSLIPSSSTISIVETVKGHPPVETIAPGAGYYALGFSDPVDTLHPRFLYAYHAVGPGWSDSLADDAPESFPSFLYLNHNITAEQPCPWIEYIAPTIQIQGSAVSIVGAGFGDLPTTYGGEVRLYESFGVGGSYVTMSSTSWSNTNISVTVPSASSGWVTVVHTTGTPTCVGSNQKLLTITQTLVDPEAGWWIEVVDYKNITSQPAQPHVISARIAPVMNDIGTGRLDIPLSDQDLGELIDPDNHIGRFVRVYLDRFYRYGFYLENLRHDVTDDGGSIAAIEGRGLEVLASRAFVLPHDQPSNPSLAPTWIYGSTDNFIDNPSFEDDLEILKNPNGEEGNDDDGNAIGWSSSGDDVNAITGIEDAGLSQNGDWCIEVDASDNHSGMAQSLSVEPNRVYHIKAYVKEPTAAGMRITLAIGGDDDIEKTGTYGNNFYWDNDVLAELDNVARNGAANGCPGGSSDGTWQVLDCEVRTGPEQKSMSITIQDDHHYCSGNNVHVPFYVDDVFVVGWGLGLDPWKAYRPASHNDKSFLLSELYAMSSGYTCFVNSWTPGAGIEQTIAVMPNTKYTFTGYLYTKTPTGVWNLDIMDDDGKTVLSQDSHIPTGYTHEQYQTVYTMSSTQEEVVVRFSYQGAGDPDDAWMDNFSLVPGELAATPGTIMFDLMGPIQARGTIDFLDLTSFDGVNDSAGNPWYSRVAIDINPGETIKNVLDRFVALGYEWEIVPVNFDEGNDTGAQLNIYNSRALGSGMGFDRTLSEIDSIVIEVGRNSIMGGRVNKRVFSENAVFAIDQDGNWSMSETTDIAADEAAYGRIEGYLQATVGDTSTLADFANSRLTDAADAEFAIEFDFVRDSQLRPFLHFGLGDSVFVDPTPYGGRTTKRVRSIVAELSGEGNEIAFDVNLSKVIFEDQAAVIAAVNQLKERAPNENTGLGTGRVGSSASGFVTTTIVSETVVPHTHKLDSAEIKNKSLYGDVSGELPGPVSVQKIRGQNISTTIPADTGGDVVWVYDRDYKQWIPIEIASLGGFHLNTKGDIHGFGTEDVRIPVGSNKHVLTADSTKTPGVEWAPITIPVYSSDPENPAEGWLIVNTTETSLKIFMGGAWHTVSGEATQTPVIEALGVVDSILIGGDQRPRFYEEPDVIDVVLVSKDSPAITTDIVGVTDAAISAKSIDDIVIETLDVTDSLSIQGNLRLTITETLDVTDSLSIQGNLRLTITEGVDVSDLTSPVKFAERIATDSVGVTDDTTPVEG